MATTTQLDAVNTMLSAIGEAPVNSLSSGLVEAEIAETILNTVDREVQGDLPPMAAGLFGYFGYDMIRQIETIPDQNTAAIAMDDSLLFPLFKEITASYNAFRADYKIWASRAYLKAKDY